MSHIKFGFVMPQGWRWLDSNGPSTEEQYQFTKSIVTLAEEPGFGTAYTYDHLMGGANFKSNRNKNLFECFLLISSLLACTLSPRCGQIVTRNSYRNPSLLAKCSARRGKTKTQNSSRSLRFSWPQLRRY
jgi:alkanesulfonate monooxygenase SsuD/methylene tetrahydromethanopterin reductase-like flavin-dependent oxidoreductase (luciferase family)